MEPHADEVVFDGPYFRIYKNGKVDRLHRPLLVAAGVDDATVVVSKDVVLDAGTGLFVRVFLPKVQDQETGKKLPVLVYFHGGGFIIESADSATYHNYLNSVAAVAGVLVVSVNYRLAPENPLPAGYDDSWAALQWAVSAQDDWIAEHGDTARVFVAGDSAGGNIVHEMLLRASSNKGPRTTRGGTRRRLQARRHWRSSGASGCSCARRRRTGWGCSGARRYSTETTMARVRAAREVR
uniref:Alpha/beta hydrolase fold-3 domain-containing protein n=1 Tax=Oryza nivara TaxID=4536 RepID=A0A0E0IKU7_ORYNI